MKMQTRQDLILHTTLHEWHLMNHVEYAGLAKRCAGTDVGRVFGGLARESLAAANHAT